MNLQLVGCYLLSNASIISQFVLISNVSWPIIQNLQSLLVFLTIPCLAIFRQRICSSTHDISTSYSAIAFIHQPEYYITVYVILIYGDISAN